MATTTDVLNLELGRRASLIPKVQVNFPLYYSIGGKRVWSPLYYPNAAIFYGEARHRAAFLKRMVLPNREARYSEVVLYSFHREDRKSSRAFKAMRMDSSLEVLLDRLLAACGEVHENNPKGDPNKTLNIVILDLTPVELLELANPAVVNKLMDLLVHGEEARIYPIMLAKKAKQVPRAVHQILSFAAYLTEKNEPWAFEFSGLRDYELYNVNRALAGMLYLKNHPALVPINDLVYEPSAYKVERQRVAGLEEDAYREFLKNFLQRD